MDRDADDPIRMSSAGRAAGAGAAPPADAPVPAARAWVAFHSRTDASRVRAQSSTASLLALLRMGRAQGVIRRRLAGEAARR